MSALAFRPTPPPRFDVFSELLLGSWKTANNNEEQIVEEVMRSCGKSTYDKRLHLLDDLTEAYMLHFLLLRRWCSARTP